jgi:predicted ribosomally synthesized peptide with SipW-like signal peptide
MKSLKFQLNEKAKRRPKMHRKIATSFLVLSAVLVMTIGATGAYFSDANVITGNVFSTGTWSEVYQWCSPGYWRQTHHLASWDATGYSPNSLFSEAIGYFPTLSTPGIKNNASPNPTLLYLLNNNNYYSGADFNAVGDLLSTAHPDVNFLGERVEDSCPL